MYTHINRLCNYPFSPLLSGFNILIHDILLYESSLSKMMQTREEGGEEREEQIEGITSTEKASNGDYNETSCVIRSCLFSFTLPLLFFPNVL